MLRWPFLILIVFLLGCNSTKQINKPNQLLFSIEKGPCFGACPEYKIEVFTNGEAHLKGIRNVEHVGEFKSQISDSLLDEMKKSIEAMNIASLDTNYVNKYLTDFPTVDLAFDVSGERKRIHLFDESLPLEIQSVVDVITGYENRIKWDFSEQK
jgi:hypothetical protein